MADLDDFSKRTHTLGVRIAEGGDRVVRKVALAVDQAVVMATPVDKGRARSNWLVGIDAAPSEQIDPYVPGEKGSTGAANTQAAIDHASGVVAGYDGDANREIHITNNLPYIGRLNEGSSAQAPAMYVEAGVAAGAAAVREARILED